MLIDRRTVMSGAAAIFATSAMGKRRAPANWYDRAIIIDALGGVGDPYSPEEQLRLGDRAWKEMVATGVTMLRDTVMPVGNLADGWVEYQKDIALKQNILNANPDRLILVRSAADILKAKREKKFGVVIGTQDTSMVPSGRAPRATAPAATMARKLAASAGPTRSVDTFRPNRARYSSAVRACACRT